MSGENLLEKAKRGDQEAVTELLKRHGPAARTVVAGQVPKKHQAVLSEDDIMQQTYADAFFKLDQLVAEDEAGFAAWLKMIAKRNLLDAVKSLDTQKQGGDRRQVKQVITDESFVSFIRLVSDSGPTPSRIIAGSEAIAAMKKAVGELPDDYRLVVTEVCLKERPAKEVAAEMNRSEGAVFMLRARALERLHEIMGRTSKFLSSS